MAFSLEKYQQFYRDLQVICEQSGRDVNTVSVLAATKYSNAQDINTALAAGVVCIGENRVQDGVLKFPLLHKPCEKHFIGHLQTNKVKKAVEYFDVIESVDRVELIQKLASECEKIDKRIDVCIQVNIAKDQAKFGVTPEMIPLLMDHIHKTTFLRLRGFMAIVPYVSDPELSRSWFRAMKNIFDEYLLLHPYLDILSMGMTHDFRVAVEEGATELRIGSLFFL